MKKLTEDRTLQADVAGEIEAAIDRGEVKVRGTHALVSSWAFFKPAEGTDVVQADLIRHGAPSSEAKRIVRITVEVWRPCADCIGCGAVPDPDSYIPKPCPSCGGTGREP